MALIFLEQTKCALCGEILLKGDEIVGLPPSSDTTNPLYKFFDCGFHKSCYLNWEKREEVEKIIAEERKAFENSDHYKEMIFELKKPK